MSESVVTLSRFQADVSRSLARRGKRMLDMPDLAEQVAKLEPLEAYLIVKELGVEDAYPILKHATREQLQTLVDLDCWEGWSPDIEEINTWLAAFADEDLKKGTCQGVFEHRSRTASAGCSTKF
ncbi:MAG: DUF6178 family protein [Myxococcota bacterium]